MVSRERASGLFVRINIARFIENVSLDGIELRPAEAAQFLREWGFRHCTGDLWRCDEDAIACLREDEIAERVPGQPFDIFDPRFS